MKNIKTIKGTLESKPQPQELKFNPLILAEKRGLSKNGQNQLNSIENHYSVL